MPCKYCDQNWFWKKIGRCQRCINQLTVLCILFWVFWFSWGNAHSKETGVIALIVFGGAFHCLLALHLWMKFITLPLRKHKHK
ncbi:DUF3624 domain-containing protein [Vibrio quintilis]|uniref:DUF3624 domain-containing protein n=1 Tax=Vibrio quintilis TaxID=1117707 RepID=UPI0009356E92|nr:DUF3624 domain-containing protein [Vibrio quintilis]